MEPLGSGPLGLELDSWSLDPEVFLEISLTRGFQFCIGDGPESYKEPGGLPFPGLEEICSRPGGCMGTRKFLTTLGHSICILRDRMLQS